MNKKQNPMNDGTYDNLIVVLVADAVYLRCDWEEHGKTMRRRRLTICWAAGTQHPEEVGKLRSSTSDQWMSWNAVQTRRLQNWRGNWMRRCATVRDIYEQLCRIVAGTPRRAKTWGTSCAGWKPVQQTDKMLLDILSTAHTESRQLSNDLSLKSIA